MPVYGKKASPQELIGEIFIGASHKIDRGEHQVWIATHNAFFIFFEPITCCEAVTLDYMDSFEGLEYSTIKSISYEKGTYLFTLGEEKKEWAMSFISRKKQKNIPMLKMSRQDRR